MIKAMDREPTAVDLLLTIVAAVLLFLAAYSLGRGDNTDIYFVSGGIVCFGILVIRAIKSP
jgi:hypothetical protein